MDGSQFNITRPQNAGKQKKKKSKAANTEKNAFKRTCMDSRGTL